MAYALNQRFDPKERAEALKIEFKHRKRNARESMADFAHELKRLAGKAYYKLSCEAQEEWILDQFINGLNSDSLEEYVRLSHPHDIDHAVSLAIEYEAIKTSKSYKFRNSEAELNVIHNTTTCTSDELQKMKNEIMGELKSFMTQIQPIDGSVANVGQQIYGSRQNFNSSSDRYGDACNYCKEHGHYKNECRKLKAKLEKEQYMNSNYQGNVTSQNTYQNQQNTNFGGNQTYRQENNSYQADNVGQNNTQWNTNNPIFTNVNQGN